MLSGIFPTGYPATELAGVQPGDSVGSYGAGPVRPMAACSATVNSGLSRSERISPHQMAQLLVALAGYVTNPQGRPWAASMVINDDAGASRGRPVLDALVDHIARVRMPQPRGGELRGEMQ